MWDYSGDVQYSLFSTGHTLPSICLQSSASERGNDCTDRGIQCELERLKCVSHLRRPTHLNLISFFVEFFLKNLLSMFKRWGWSTEDHPDAVPQNKVRVTKMGLQKMFSPTEWDMAGSTWHICFSRAGFKIKLQDKKKCKCSINSIVLINIVLWKTLSICTSTPSPGGVYCALFGRVAGFTGLKEREQNLHMTICHLSPAIQGHREISLDYFC